MFESTHELAAAYGVEVDTAIGMGRPARNIVDRAEAFDVVVMGSHGGDLQSRLFVGASRTRCSADPQFP